MAESELEISIKWENGQSFEMTAKRNDDAVKTVVKVDENGQFKHLWEDTQSICEIYLKKTLNGIGTEMKG